MSDTKNGISGGVEGSIASAKRQAQTVGTLMASSGLPHSHHFVLGPPLKSSREGCRK
jgi:hypothetical protein